MNTIPEIFSRIISQGRIKFANNQYWHSSTVITPEQCDLNCELGFSIITDKPINIILNDCNNQRIPLLVSGTFYFANSTTRIFVELISTEPRPDPATVHIYSNIDLTQQLNCDRLQEIIDNIPEDIEVSNFPTSIDVGNFPTSIDVGNFPTSIDVGNFPTSIDVGNFPATTIVDSNLFETLSNTPLLANATFSKDYLTQGKYQTASLFFSSDKNSATAGVGVEFFDGLTSLGTKTTVYSGGSGLLTFEILIKSNKIKVFFINNTLAQTTFFFAVRFNNNAIATTGF